MVARPRRVIVAHVVAHVEVGGQRDDIVDLDVGRKGGAALLHAEGVMAVRDRKSTRLNSSHSQISYAVFCLKKKKIHLNPPDTESHNIFETPDRVITLT